MANLQRTHHGKQMQHKSYIAAVYITKHKLNANTVLNFGGKVGWKKKCNLLKTVNNFKTINVELNKFHLGVPQTVQVCS